jgi:hypothetical protein
MQAILVLRFLVDQLQYSHSFSTFHVEPGSVLDQGSKDYGQSIVTLLSQRSAIIMF